MATRDFQGIAMELALLAANHKFPRLSQIGAAWGEDTGEPTKVDLEPAIENPVRIDTNTEGFGIFILDITYSTDGKIYLIEANGSNAALTSAIKSKDDKRARHMTLSFTSKKKPAGQVVVLLAYQSTLLHIGEYFGRAGIFAEQVSEIHSVRLCNTDENLGDEEVSIICGSIDKLAEYTSFKNGKLYFKHRPVVFACNPNLLPELARRDIIPRKDGWYDFETKFYHENSCTPVIHDKGVQQDLARGTGITPLFHKEANSEKECYEVIKQFHEKGMVAVGKMNAGSGGTGIEFFPPTVPFDELKKRLDNLFDTAKKKYGEDSMKTIFPIRFFQFARSTNYNIYGNNHLWDLRLQCLVYPGYTEVTPCVIRLCPKPFDEVNYEWDSVVSNLSGRDPSQVGRFMRSPAAMRRSQPRSVLEEIGINREKLNYIANCCAAWCESAWKHYSK
jgi:hypothetical protein